LPGNIGLSLVSAGGAHHSFFAKSGLFPFRASPPFPPCSILERSVVALVEPPAVDHREVHEIHLFKSQPQVLMAL